MAAIYHIEMLGGLRVRHGDRTATRFRTRKTGELLAYLACDRARMHPRELLIELLFPEIDLSARLGNLSKLLSFLRAQFEAGGDGANALLRTDRQSVGLNAQGVTTDVMAFETCLLEAQRAVSDLTRTQALSDAAALYTGPLLPEFYSDWVLGLRERLAQQYLQALRTLVRLLAKSGDTARALEYAQRAVQADPLLEEAHIDLIRLYMMIGQPERALRQYRELEYQLSHELNIVPSNRARQLLTQLQEARDSTPSAGSAAEIVTTLEPRTTAPSRMGERTDDRSLHAMPPPTSGTITFLLVDLTVAMAATAAASFEALNVRLRAELRRHGGGQLRSDPSLLLAAFGRASDAGYGALAIRALLVEETPTSQPRIALDTREVRLKDGDDISRLLELGLRLLKAGHEGQILCDEATATLLNRDPSPILQVEPLGSYRLQTGATSCRLFQLQDRDTPRSFPALRAPSGDPVHLPALVTRFFGREEDLQRLRDLLLEPAVRLITLMGPGGIGKTRLAREAASYAAEVAGLAVWWADLTELTEADRLPETLLTTLRRPLSPSRSALEQLVEATRSQPTLLILDNFERLVEDGAEVVSELLARTPDLKLLVTSRQALELSAEHRMELLPLPVPIQSVEYRVSGVEKQGAHMRRQSSPEAQWQVQDSQSALPDTRHPAHDTLLSVPSVGLFVDRVQLVRLDFRLGRHNAEAVAALCARLEGIPLAIELAAARAHLLTPAQMLAQLEDRFAFLVSRNRDIPSRHRTLRATLEWSVRLLSPELQRFLARLSVFRGGWTLEAADSICAEVGRGVGGPHLPEKPAPDEEGKESRSSSLTLLEVLCNNSLVIAQETVEGGFRFRMLETVREFAAGLLEGSDEADQVRTRHGDWCVKLSTAGQRASSGPEQQIWMDRLELEHDNLRAALAWSLARAQNSENCEASPPLTALRLCVMLPYFWWTRGYFCEGRAWCDAVLDRIGRTALNHERGDVLLGVGVIAMRQGDYTAARAYFEESLAIRRALKHPRGISQVLNNLGMLACDEGDYEAAHAYYVESLSIKRELGDQQAVAGTLNNMGMVAQSRGDFIEAETLYQEALRINRESGNRAFEANNLNNLGLAAEFQGDLLRARAYYVESLPIRQAIGDRWGIAYSLYCLGHVDCLLDDYRSAEDYLQESLTIRKEIGHRPGIAQTLNALAELAAAFYWAGSTGTAISRPDDGDSLGLVAARLWGAATVLRHAIGDRLSAWEQEALDRKIAVVRDQFGPIAFDAAWSAGKGMSMDQAIAYAQSQSICL